jgi:hypothetical protein
MWTSLTSSVYNSENCGTGSGGFQPGNTCSLKDKLEGFNPPKVGDTISLIGRPFKVEDFGNWKEMKGKYPELVPNVFETMSAGITEEMLGRTWLLVDKKGKKTLIGKADLKRFRDNRQHEPF